MTALFYLVKEMWKDKFQIVYEYRDGRMLLVGKDDYRVDGSQVIILDSKTAELAKTKGANWKTINGAHVLIGKGGNIIAGMGGKIENINSHKHKFVNGKDLSNTFEFAVVTPLLPIEQIIKAQGFDGKPQVVKKSEFTKACEQSDFVIYRGIKATDERLLKAYDDSLKNGEFYVQCSGGTLHGYGMYGIAAHYSNGKTSSGRIRKNKQAIMEAENDVQGYTIGEASKVYTMTFGDKIKLGYESKLQKEMLSDERFMKTATKPGYRGMDNVGVYAALKGYDAYIGDIDYDDPTQTSVMNFQRNTPMTVVVLNRSKVVILDD